MLKLLHRIVANPLVYDFSQKLAGEFFSHSLLKKEFAAMKKMESVLDVGGGTGGIRQLIPSDWNYTCLDLDPLKIKGFKKKYPNDYAVLASAVNIPVQDSSYSLCILSAVSHHLDENEFKKSLSEIKRVIKPNGKFLFLEAYLNKKNVFGNLLWAVDRGSFPRQPCKIVSILNKYFEIKTEKRWKILHNYMLIIGLKEIKL